MATKAVAKCDGMDCWVDKSQALGQQIKIDSLARAFSTDLYFLDGYLKRGSNSNSNYNNSNCYICKKKKKG